MGSTLLSDAKIVRQARSHISRLLGRQPPTSRFRGAFPTRAEAIRAIRPGALVGYDNDEVVDISVEAMSRIAVWDYPVLFWLQTLKPASVLDAGGHIGTKYRAFRGHLELESIRWIVYDVPAVVRAGKARAEAEGLAGLTFTDDARQAPAVHLLLASGLLQYIDVSLSDLIDSLRAKPAFLLINKVATRDGDELVALENFGCAEVPYRIRNRRAFEAEVTRLGYTIRDEWEIPDLSHTIADRPDIAPSVSRGYLLALRSGDDDESRVAQVGRHRSV